MKPKTIQSKILVYTGVCLAIALVVSVGYAAISLRGNEAEAARDRAGGLAGEQANMIENELDVAMNISRTLAQTFAAIRDPENPLDIGRDDVNAIMRRVLQDNPSVLGVYTCWEPDAFDGKDAEYQGKPGHDKTGRFIPYVCRDASGKIVEEPLFDYDKSGTGDYYQLPKTTAKECLLDPYIYPVAGKDTLITSLVVPILVDGKFVGIAGVDFKLAFLQELADKVDLYDGSAELAIISYGGTLAGVTGHAKLVGEHGDRFFGDLSGDLPTIQKGDGLYRQNAELLEVFTPLKVGATTTPWSVSVRIPADKVMVRATSQMWLMVGIGATCAIAGLGAMWVVARGISTPIKRIIEGLTAGAGQTASAAGEVSSSSQSLAQGTSEQAAAIEETTSSIEEMSSMIKQNADNAQEARNLAAAARGSADTGGEAMGRMSSAIDDIKTSSDETAKIIKTIDEIAFQTNLLALNAAVEAARAGEAGKGFAVVAEEVRNLAQRSAEAAKNTAEMIDGATKNADNGVAISKEVAASLSEIAEGSRKVNDLVAEIAAASTEQSQGIDQINQAVSQMDQVTQSNAANAEESASASEELAAQAAGMQGMVDQLVVMVGSSGESESAPAPRSTAPASGKQPLAGSDATWHKIAEPTPTSASAEPPTPSDSPQDVIPMNDSELSKF